MEDQYAPFTTATFSAAAILSLATALLSGRATLVESFVQKQWHVPVFLLLNVVLLGILFTSRDHPTAVSGSKQAEKKRRMGRRPRSGPVEAGRGSEDERRGEEDASDCELSNEELNERVENFIAAFRQHLVLDGMTR